MKRKAVMIFLICLFTVSSFTMAQEIDLYSQLDPKPYDPETEPNIDLFISSWKESMPRHSHGNLLERDIFTPCDGDPMRPKTKGEVLTVVKRFSHASLEPHASTTPTTLKGEQEIFYFDSGKGIVKTKNKTAEVYEGVGVLMPEGLEFTMTNTGDEPLTMYLIVEPVPEGFKPKKEMAVKDENVLPLGGTTGHWSHITKAVIRKEDGLATLIGMCPVWYDPMTMGQPHSHNVGTEEIWFALKGDISLLLGKQFRKLPVGSAYKIPPNGKTPHSNINASDKPIKLFWLMYNTSGETIPYANLDPKPFDPKVDPNIDMFMGSYLESMPKHTHGSLIERDVLTKCEGDVMNPTARGAVLRYVNRFTHATLQAHHSTIPTTPKGEQEFYYVISGNGTVTGGGKTNDIHAGSVFLIPENLEFTMTNTGDKALTMYLVVEPTHPGFKPNDYIYVNDESSIQTFTSTSHWINVWEHLIKPEDGLAQMQLVLTVWLYPQTFAQPHSHNETTEEVWVTVEGDVKFLMGKQIRDLPPGMAHMIPPNSTTPHANFNITDKPIKLFYFARFGD